MQINDYKHIYMIGIGGISMSGIAEILVKWNFQVSGSNNVTNEQTEWLEKNGVKVNIGHAKENIHNEIDLVVYTAAIKEDNPEIIEAKKYGIPIVERGNFLGEITKLFKDTIGIAGTHGKTSTTSMVASSFLEAELDPSIQVGTFLNKINGNYRVGQSDYFIIEACEYAESYLNFQQRSAIVLNIDDDHLDYFGTIENIKKSFEKYVSHLPENGLLVLNREDERCYDLRNFTKAQVITVGKTDRADWHYENITYDVDGYPSYDAYKGAHLVNRMTLHVTGEHMVFNSLCCLALCDAYGINPSIVAGALKEYSGASRRLEYKGEVNGAKVYDDYGHHPTEIAATVKGLLNKKFHESWVVFEPHTYSRLAQHLKEFASSLIPFDHIVITDIYAAREINTYAIHEDDLIKEIKALGKEAIHISDLEEIVSYLKKQVNQGDIVLSLGAGNVTKVSQFLTK